MLQRELHDTLRPSRESDASLEEIANISRNAMLAFVHDVPLNRRALASWLLGPYARATSFVERATAPLRVAGHSLSLDDTVVLDLVIRTRLQIVELLGQAATTWGSTIFAPGIVGSGIVASVRDRDGVLAFAAVD